MAISPKQIEAERSAAFQDKVNECEAQINASLRLFWDSSEVYPRKKRLDITDILRKHSEVRDAVIANYSAVGWKINKIETGYKVYFYEISASE